MSWQYAFLPRVVGIRRSFVSSEPGLPGPDPAPSAGARTSRPLASTPHRLALYIDLDRRRRHAQIAARKVLASHGGC